MTARSIEIIETLRKAGFTVDERYAGPKPARWMRGETFIGVDIRNITELFTLGQLLAPFDGMGEPKINAISTGWMVFWPDLTSPTQKDWDAFHDEAVDGASVDKR